MQLTKTHNQFTHEIFGNLTTITNENGDVFFIGKEVATFLGYSDTDYAIRTHCKSVMSYADDYSGQVRNVNNISERDLHWRRLKKRSLSMGYIVKTVPCPRFKTRNLYHIDVFRAEYPKLKLNGLVNK